MAEESSSPNDAASCDENPCPPGAAASYRLPADMTVETAESVWNGLKAASVGDAAVFTLDASDTCVLTTPGLQVIASLARTLAARGGRLELVHAGQAFSDSCAQTGFSGFLAQTTKT